MDDNLIKDLKEGGILGGSADNLEIFYGLNEKDVESLEEVAKMMRKKWYSPNLYISFNNGAMLKYVKGIPFVLEVMKTVLIGTAIVAAYFVGMKHGSDKPLFTNWKNPIHIERKDGRTEIKCFVDCLKTVPGKKYESNEAMLGLMQPPAHLRMRCQTNGTMQRLVRLK